MAVTVLNRQGARSRLVAPTLPTGVLLVTLIAPAADLLASVQPVLVFEGAIMVFSVAAAAVLALVWARLPNSAWLFVAFAAAAASATLRMAGIEVAPLLSLLAIFALGAGGAFAHGDPAMQRLFGLQPSVARR